jgi:hypothetical protein
MKHTEYYQSGRHTDNALAARNKALDKIRSNKQQRIDAYDQNPSRCIACDKAIGYESRGNKFCSKSCAGTYNNAKRPAGSASRMAQGKKVKGKKRVGSYHKGQSNTKVSKIKWHTCVACSKIFYTKTWSSPRKTCGNVECVTHLKVGHRPYTNGRRKLFRYHNKWDDTEVLLESSWENDLAIWLDLHGIEWHRPKPIQWYDSQSDKTRLYYPDFWLPTIDIYCDPKNPTAMLKDQFKMSVVSALIPIIYGDLGMLKSQIDDMVKSRVCY